MVKEQIEFEVLASDYQRKLAADEGEPNAKLDEKLAELGEESAFEIALLSFFRESQEVEVVGIFAARDRIAAAGASPESW